MKTTVVLALGLSLCLAGCSSSSLPAPAPHPAASTPEIREVSGDVSIRKAGSPAWIPARHGTRLAAGDRVWARGGRATIAHPGGEVMRVQDQAIVEIR